VEQVLKSVPGATAFTLGDNVYDSGTPEEFKRCYAPTWGRFKDRTLPSLGNHDYRTKGAAGYFGYFGARAGDPTKGYYSVEQGPWHVVVLNSSCNEVPGGCGPDSPQAVWLKNDLATHPATCTVALWHHPVFSSGPHGESHEMHDMFQILDDGGADLVLNGHDHIFERFSPMHADGTIDEARGVRELVVGSGGKSHYALGTTDKGSVVRDNVTAGVLVLELQPTSYQWRFVGIDGRVHDEGTGTCH
jgi:hypothetical protein